MTMISRAAIGVPTQRWIIIGLVVVAGCSSPGYVLEQAWGQLKVMHNRERISDVLRREDLDPRHKRKLKLALTIRKFTEEIGLRKTGAYTRFYDTGNKPLAYNLSACPATSLKPKIWRFPIVGGLSYIGFFDKKKGLIQQRELDRQGYDTYLRPVPAFSSLGWFADPVYSPMLEDDISRLADIIIHETTHTTIFIRNQVAFNESLAVFIGNQGALNFLARLYGPASQEVKEYGQSIMRRRRFSIVISWLYTQLSRLYRSDLPRATKLRRKQEMFAEAKKRYKAIFPNPQKWGSFVHRPLNNAILLSYGRYNQGITFHRRVYQVLGRNLRRMVALYKKAQRFNDPIAYIARFCGIKGFIKQRM